MNTVRTALTISLLLICTAARADWQFTRWGESAAEVTASGNNVEKLQPAETEELAKNSFGDVLLDSTFAAKASRLQGDIQTTVYFGFAGDALNAVMVDLDEKSFGLVAQRELERRLGPPDVVERSEGKCAQDRLAWRDTQNGNYITLGLAECRSATFRNRTVVIYTPLNAKGRGF